MALHYAFQTPNDSFLFDVSHQTYVHKLLTRAPGAVSHHTHSGWTERVHGAQRKARTIVRRGPRRYGALGGAGHGGCPRQDRWKGNM